jgi:hypothetical protein
MKKCITNALWISFLSITLLACGGGGDGGGSGSGSGSMDEASARKFAWAVQIAVQDAAPYTQTVTYNNTVKTGFAGGTATLTGSTFHSYDSYTGRSVSTYNNVQIIFSNYSGDSNFPSFSGTVVVTGTCTKQYGTSTTYSGYWNAEGYSLTVGSNQADILIQWQREGMYWVAGVDANGRSWSFSI